MFSVDWEVYDVAVLNSQCLVLPCRFCAGGRTPAEEFGISAVFSTFFFAAKKVSTLHHLRVDTEQEGQPFGASPAFAVMVARVFIR